MIGSESEDIMDSMKDTPTLKGEKPMKIIRKAKGISQSTKLNIYTLWYVYQNFIGI